MRASPISLEKKCFICRKVFFKNPKRGFRDWEQKKFCSRVCYRKGASEFQGNAMRKVQERFIQSETPKSRKERMAKIIERRKEKWAPPMLGKVGELNPNWKGDKAGYFSKHEWIRKHHQKTGKCESCERIPKPYGNKRLGTEWACITDKHLRTIEDYVELCKSCHVRFDKAKRLARHLVLPSS